MFLGFPLYIGRTSVLGLPRGPHLRSFVVTAGVQTIQVGYVSEQFGSISRQPITDDLDTLFGVYTTNGATFDFVFFGNGGEDTMALLNGKIVYSDGTPLPGVWNLGEGLTYELAMPDEFPAMENEGEYRFSFGSIPAWSALVRAGAGDDWRGFVKNSYGSVVSTRLPADAELVEISYDTVSGTGWIGISGDESIGEYLANRGVLVNGVLVDPNDAENGGWDKDGDWWLEFDGNAPFTIADGDLIYVAVGDLLPD